MRSISTFRVSELMIKGYSLIAEERVDPQLLSEIKILGLSALGLTPSLLGILDVDKRNEKLKKTVEVIEKADMEVAFIQGITFGLNLATQNFTEAMTIRLDKISEINEFFPLNRVFVGAPDLRLKTDLWGQFLDLAREYSSPTLEFSFENICNAGESSIHHAPFGVGTLMYEFPLIIDVANHLDCENRSDHSWAEKHDLKYAHISHRSHNLPVGAEEATQIKHVLEGFNFDGTSYFEVMHKFDFNGTRATLNYLN